MSSGTAIINFLMAGRKRWMMIGITLLSLTLSGQEVVRIDTVIISGNEKTRDGIILRECLFDTGDQLVNDSLAPMIRRSEENLMNTGLFNFATITPNYLDEDMQALAVTVEVVERWYIWPVPIIRISDRNFNVWWENRDFSRISYGFYIDWKNFTGRMDKMRAHLQLGYDEEIRFEYSTPYLNRKKTFGAGLSYGFRQNHEVAAGTKDNRHIFYKDPEEFVFRNFFISTKATLRQSYYNIHEFSLGYSFYQFDDSLLVLYPWYSSGTTRDEFLSVFYRYKSDHRDYHAYPLNGHYFDLEISKIGLGLFNGGPDFITVGSTFRKYWQLNRFLHYAFGMNGLFSNDSYQPYYLVRGIGYGRDVVRGYEYYVIDAQNFAIFKSNLKFTLFNKPNAKIPFIKSEKFGRLFYGFYLNFFADVGYADKSYYYGENGAMHNKLLFGYGAGLDFTTYYDVVIRAEYSFNVQGESGLFIHFMASI